MANGGLSSGTTSVSAWVCGESTSGIRVVASDLADLWDIRARRSRVRGLLSQPKRRSCHRQCLRFTHRSIDARFADYSRRVQSEDACFLTSIQAQCLLSQFRETCQYRGWSLLAAAILANHVHAVIGLPDTVVGASAMKDLKSYGSRALNLSGGISKRRSWWAIGGSCRRLVSGEYRENAMEYVCRQVTPLALWHTDDS